jgi:signal transduction histidine kinase
VTNAVEAAQSKGQRLDVSVDLSTVELDGRSWGRLEITDNAGGIPSELAERINKRYYSPVEGYRSTKAGPNRGLGLAIVKKVIAGHGGRLDIQPAGKGTRVVLYIPALASVGESSHADGASS